MISSLVRLPTIYDCVPSNHGHLLKLYSIAKGATHVTLFQGWQCDSSIHIIFHGWHAAPPNIHTVACISPHCTNAQASCISFFRPVRLHVGEFHSDHVYFDRGSKADSKADSNNSSSSGSALNLLQQRTAACPARDVHSVRTPISRCSWHMTLRLHLRTIQVSQTPLCIMRTQIRPPSSIHSAPNTP